MNNRRRFIQQSALATTALIAANPLKTLASFTSIGHIGNSNKQLVLLHTAETELSTFGSTFDYIRNIKSNAANKTILANTSLQQTSGLHYDVAQKEAIEKYTIIKKAGVVIGMIYVKPDHNVIQETDELAAMLKNEKDCQLIVCISQLGYLQENKVDDTSLASSSENIDIIISGHPSNYFPKTRIAANKKKHEVIIQSSNMHDFACGKIEISFDANGRKNNVCFAKKLKSQQEPFAA